MSMNWGCGQSDELPVVLERLKDLVERASSLVSSGPLGSGPAGGGGQVDLGEVDLASTSTSLVPCAVPGPASQFSLPCRDEGVEEPPEEWWALPTMIDVEDHLGRHGYDPLTKSQRRRMRHRGRRERWLRTSRRSEVPYPVQRVLCRLGVAPRQPFSSKYMYGLDRQSPVTTLVTVDSDGEQKPYEMHTYLGDDRWEVELLS